MKKVEDYLALPYTMIVRWDGEDAIFVAQIQELPGCSAHGDSPAEALDMLRDNQASWIEAALDAGERIPLPQQEDDLPSGKWLQRVPRSLHKRVIECSEAEGVSLNTYVTYCLSRAVGLADAADIQKSYGVVNAIYGNALPNFALQHEHKANYLAMYGGTVPLSWSGSEPYKALSSFHHTGHSEETKGYSVILETLAGQLSSHIVDRRIKGKSRDEKESYESHA
jgi:antitoxin HicB